MSVVDGTIILLCLTCGASSRPVLTAVRRYGCCVFFLTPWNFFCLSLSFPLCNCVRVLRKPQFHRDTIHGDVSCRRRDHIALADVRCVVTAGLDGIASLRLLCLLLKTVELTRDLHFNRLSSVVQQSNVNSQSPALRVRFSQNALFFFFVWLHACAVHVLCHGRPQRRRGHAPQP